MVQATVAITVSTSGNVRRLGNERFNLPSQVAVVGGSL
jgi:hypothetical protein